jgi:Tol biopolymer transport system component
MVASPFRVVLLSVGAFFVGLVPAAAPAGKTVQIAFESNRTGNYQIYVMNANGTLQTQLTLDRANFDPAWSPGGGQLVIERDNATGNYADIWVMNQNGKNLRQLTNMKGPSRNPAWSPGGNQIAFQYSKDPAGPYTIYLADVTSWATVKKPKPLTLGKGVTFLADNGSHPAWSTRGDRIAFDSTRSGNSEIWVVGANGKGLQQLTKTPNGALSVNPAWSPGDKTIAFASNRSGGYQIWVMNAKLGSSPTRLTGKSPSDGQNFDPSWSPDGKTIVFASNRKGNLQLYSMNADGSKPTRLTTNAAVDLAPNFWQNKLQ